MPFPQWSSMPGPTCHSSLLEARYLVSCIYGLSPNSGWIDSELFTEWFERHFLLYAPAGRPILLMLDGHSSHYDPHFIRLSPNSGWIDSELFIEWFERHFLLYVPAGRPILLMLDGHSSHYDPHFIRSAAEKGVSMFMLPPNTTHIAQPLDNTPFKCFKGCWDDECNTYMPENPGKVVTIYQFSELFAAAWRKATSGFRANGVFPVNHDAIEIPGVKQHSKATPLATVAKKNGINYLPLFSPAPRKPRALTISHSSVLLPESLVHALVCLLSLL